MDCTTSWCLASGGAAAAACVASASGHVLSADTSSLLAGCTHTAAGTYVATSSLSGTAAGGSGIFGANILLLPDGQIVVVDETLPDGVTADTCDNSQDVTQFRGEEVAGFVADSAQADADAGIPELEAEPVDAPASTVPGITLTAEKSLAVPSLAPPRVAGTAPALPEGKVVRVLEPAMCGACVVRATPAHLVFASHAITLAAIQGMSRGDMARIGDDAVKNSESVTPLGAVIVRRLLGAGATRQPDAGDDEYYYW